MGVLFELLALTTLIFASIKIGWPWSIGLWAGYLLFFGTKRTPISKRIAGLSPRLGIWIVAFFSVWFLLGWLFTRAFQTAGGTSTSEFLFGGTSLPVFWGFLSALIITLGIFLIVLVLPAAFLMSRGMYGKYDQVPGQVRRATKNAVGLTLGVSQGNWEVKNGQIVSIDQGKGRVTRVGGPGQLTVQQGYAVILEKSGQVSRVVGLGIHFLEPLETVSMVVPLFTRSEQIFVPEIASRDRVILDEIELLVFHRVDQGEVSDRTGDGLDAYNEQVLRERVWSSSGGDWRDAVKSISSRCMRDVVGRYTLQELVPLSDTNRERFREDLREQIERITRNALGVEIRAVDVGMIRVSKEMQARLLERWTAEWDQQVAQTRAETDKSVQLSHALARMETIQAISQGLKQLLGPEASPQDLVAMRFIEYLEQRAQSGAAQGDSETDALIRLQSLETLRSLGTRHRNGGSDGAAIGDSMHSTRISVGMSSK